MMQLMTISLLLRQLPSEKIFEAFGRQQCC